MAPMAMSDHDEVVAQWMSQMQAMRDAIAELKLPSDVDSMQLNGLDILPQDSSSANDLSSDDLWDLISEDEEGTSESEVIEDTPQTNGKVNGAMNHDTRWLANVCSNTSSHQSGLDAGDLLEQVTSMLVSDIPNEDLQVTLFDLMGYDEFDVIAELLSHRAEITNAVRASPNDDLMGRLETPEHRRDALERQSRQHKSKPLSEAVDRTGPVYPHVYKTHERGQFLSSSGQKYALPPGSKFEHHEKYEEHIIPASKVGTLAAGHKLIPIAEMDGLCQRTFEGYQNLNRMQSLLYAVAYNTSENMLVCAPTGAGKTDAAMLTILNTVAKNVSPNPIDSPDAADFALAADDFKVVYVAPMKALAAEITAKFRKRLAWLGVEVREFTGDMHLTKSEISRTQIIVTTPEKWDVVTRKSTGDTELVQKVRLLIIDEVHMLQDDRGAVLESLVARTERQVESTQALIRIVGLSATLPNYEDVAEFLKVNPMAGLFYFDASFRPVPLEQHFVGVTGKPGSPASRENLDQTTFEKVKDMLLLGHQCMVFVHSRKNTYKTAMDLFERAMKDASGHLFDPSEHEAYSAAVRDMKSSRARELRELLPKGMGTHHAGMARSDRNLTERLFAEGVLKVLCCTATLAWGVNLPAAAVIIKGTQLYSAEEGKFVDLGHLDVIQIFGRAGRPQFQTSGLGFICTTSDKLDHYLSTVTQQHPIESKFSKRLTDNLNAEVALGTVTSVPEAVQWLGYSYLFVRMCRQPLLYGIDWAEKRDDPKLVQRRRHLIIQAARVLQESQMIIFNETTEELRSKDVGRIASQYYVQQSSIQTFNSMMREDHAEADALKVVSMSGEFDSMQSRDTESKELSRLRTEACACEVEGGIDTVHAKTNILLQSYISRARIEDFALVSDMNYVAQNAARICRALFMIALNRRWGYQFLVLSSLCKSIEKQIWSYQHPFHQFDLPQAVLRNLDEKGSTASVESLREMEPVEIGDLVHNKKMGAVLTKLVDNFPTLSVEAEIAPLNRHVLRVSLFLTAEFYWNDRHHGTSESYWVWIENSDTSEIYHHEQFLLSRRRLHDDHELHFTIPLTDPLPSQVYVRVVSDRWLGAETVTAVSFQHLIRPDTESVYTDLLDLQPLPITALRNPTLEEVYGQRFQFFNPMQTQVFHCMYRTPTNVLLGSPTGSGKTIAAELAMWWAFREKPGSKVVYIAPMKALVRERVQDWRQRLAIPMGIKLVELTGDNTPDTSTIRNADIIITTPEKWDGISRSWQTRDYVQKVSLVIIDEIHLLGGDRGPILEIIVSRMNYIASQKEGSVRLVGMSTACANAMDLANWLGVKEGLFNFRHSVRPVPLEIYIDGFPEQRGFCPFMQSMNRPTFLAIKSHSPNKPVIVFVASRRQTRLTAKDLINFCGMEDNPRRFVQMPEEDLSLNLSRVKDDALREAMSFGIGLHHAGLVESDRQLTEELFANNKIQILVATSTLAWGVNLPAHLVVVKGTQFFDAKIEGYKDMDLTDVLQMLGRAGRPQFDTSGIARIFTQNSKKEFYKHFLHAGFPVESSLHNVLDNHLAAEISAGTVTTKTDALDYLTWTFFFRRLHKNPSYYGLDITADEQSTIAAQTRANEHIVEIVDHSLSELEASKCIDIFSNADVDPTPFGKIMSYYYLSHKTIRHLIERAKADATFEECLAWMSSATEYDDLPVRHNEDLINAELSKNLPLDASVIKLPMWDPHVKAFLLLQAHFSRIDLPISDYVGDQISVLDQSIRIIQASIDVLAEMRFVSSCIMMMTLLQCVKSARWPTDHPLLLFPGVDESKDLQSATKGMSLQEIAQKGPNYLGEIGDRTGVATAQRDHFLRAITSLPNLKINVTDVAAHQMVIHLNRINASHTKDHKMYAPRFPKSQTEGFFALLVEDKTQNIVALKRLGWPNPDRVGRQASTNHIRSVIKLSDNADHRQMTLRILSDGYIGMDWKTQGIEVPSTPFVVDQGKKSKD